ncbi:hypothetical protein KSD_97620 [Ktedonobacter sp. SOSP1-85]|nr:hypothetical protein KSD_97620 [Ktedonobacter sp. SOSP1-85]
MCILVYRLACEWIVSAVNAAVKVGGSNGLPLIPIRRLGVGLLILLLAFLWVGMRGFEPPIVAFSLA